MKRTFQAIEESTSSSSSASSIPSEWPGGIDPTPRKDVDPLRHLYPDLAPFCVLDNAGLPAVLIEMIMDYWMDIKDFYGEQVRSVGTLENFEFTNVIPNEPWRHVMLPCLADAAIGFVLFAFDGTRLDPANMYTALDTRFTGFSIPGGRDTRSMGPSDSVTRSRYIRLLYGPNVVCRDSCELGGEHRGHLPCTSLYMPGRHIKIPRTFPLAVDANGVWIASDNVSEDRTPVDSTVSRVGWDGQRHVVVTLKNEPQCGFPGHWRATVRAFSHAALTQVVILDETSCRKENTLVYTFPTQPFSARVQQGGVVGDTAFLVYNCHFPFTVLACDWDAKVALLGVDVDGTGFCGDMWQGENPHFLRRHTGRGFVYLLPHNEPCRNQWLYDAGYPVDTMVVAYCKGLLFAAFQGKLCIYQ